MAGEHWQQARLIPTSGIKTQEEAERRATSALLAVIGSVREFATSLLKPLGAPAGQVSTYIEVPFELGERTVYPDGVIQTVRGSRQWTALVEVKTGSAELTREQVESYLDVAREGGFDAVLTISNQIAPAHGVHPVDVDRRKLRKVALHHLSWAEVLTVAVQQRVHRGVADPDQAWILGELIRYLEHPRSGALDFADMSAAWVSVRESVAAGTLRVSDKGLDEVISRWEQLLRFAALRLGRELGADVEVHLSRKEAAEPAFRIAQQAESLVERGVLTGAIRIPGAVAPLAISVDVRASKVTVSIDVDSPKEGRATTRVSWLVRQLRDAPDGLRIDAFTTGTRTSTSELLRAVRENPALLIEDPKRDFRFFRIAGSSPMGTKRGTGRGGFIDSVLAAVEGFYGEVVQAIRPWSAKAPQLPAGVKTATEEAGIDLSPPRRDLLEEGPPEASDESGPSDATLLAGADANGDAETEPALLETDEVRSDVSWTDAQERLEHERDLAADDSDEASATRLGLVHGDSQ